MEVSTHTSDRLPIIVLSCMYYGSVVWLYVPYGGVALVGGAHHKLCVPCTGMGDLTAMIQARQQSRSKELDSIIGSLEEKYCKGRGSGAQATKKKARKKGG